MKDAVTSITVTRDNVPVKANFLSLVKTTVFNSEFWIILDQSCQSYQNQLYEPSRGGSKVDSYSFDLT